MTFKTLYTHLLDDGLAVVVQEYEVSQKFASAISRRAGDMERVLTLYDHREEISMTRPHASRYFLPAYMIELACVIQSKDEFFETKRIFDEIRSHQQAAGIKVALRTRLADLTWRSNE
ncbi:MAG: hypothetical protein ABIH82_00580 [Candidatus Woesearchaeota archaeon]